MQAATVKRQLEKWGAKVGLPLRCPNGQYGWHCEFPLDGPWLRIPAFQRDLSKKHVEKVLKNFNVRYARPLILSFRENEERERYCNVTDGMHTIDMHLSDGWISCYANVLFNLTDEQEAECFLVNANQRSMSGWPLFRACLLAKHTEVNEVLDIMNKYNLTHACRGFQGYRTRYADIKSACFVMEPLRAGGVEVVDVFCRLLNDCFRVKKNASERLHPRIRETTIIRGIWKFIINTWGDISYATMRRKLRSVEVTDIHRVARTITQEGIETGQFLRALEIIVLGRSRLAA